MKKLKTILVVMLIAVMGIFFTGCYGKFALTKKVYEFNGSMGNKYVKEAVFLGLVVFQVYSATAIVDGIVLNLVEFWTGSNPLALKEGINKVNIQGQDLTILLNKDKATIYDQNMKELAKLSFNEQDHTWYSDINGHTNKLMTINENTVTLYSMTGKVMEVNKNELQNSSTLLKVQEQVAMK